MKFLLFLLLIAVPAQAQSLGEVARQERERRAQLKTAARLFTSDDVRSAEPVQRVSDTASQATTASASAPMAPTPAGSPAPAAAKPPEDPAEKWRAEVEKIRDKIRQLQDQEMAAQLQVTQATNLVFAPVTDEVTRSQAQSRLADAQNRLAAVRRELEDTRRALAAMETQGPPRRQP